LRFATHLKLGQLDGKSRNMPFSAACKAHS
jgi:hypothetical protein